MNISSFIGADFATFWSGSVRNLGQTTAGYRSEVRRVSRKLLFNFKCEIVQFENILTLQH